MKIAYGLEDLPPGTKPSVATIGVFDGIHRGHQALIRAVVEKARELAVTPVLITFDRHPLEVIAPGREPPLITTVAQRAEVVAGLGIEVVLVLRFEDALRGLDPEEFVRRVLVEGLGCVHVVTGGNFRFGRDHSGTIETLTDLGARYGFGLTIFALVSGGRTLSSTLIRTQIAEGLVETVAEELGRPFRLEGIVEKGAGRGRGLGIPTSNLRMDPRIILPRTGVYAGWVRWEERRYPAVINVGLNPTFEDRTRPVVEAHLLDFDADLYGQEIAVEFIYRLRDELKFPDVDSLLARIREDIAQTRVLLGV